MSVHLVSEERAGALAGVYREIRQTLGISCVPAVFQAMAGVSADVLLQNWTAWKRTLLRGALPRPLKEMAALVAAREQESPYAKTLYAQLLINLGIEPGIVEDLAATGDSDKLSTRERSLLRWTRSHVEDPDHVSSLFLSQAGFSEDEIQQVEDTILLVDGIGQFAQEAALMPDGDRYR